MSYSIKALLGEHCAQVNLIAAITCIDLYHMESFLDPDIIVAPNRT